MPPRKRVHDDETGANPAPAKTRAPRTKAVVPAQASCDDDKGHYILQMGKDITSRYVMLRPRGEGTYGRVVECFDRTLAKNVAIKIIRNSPQYRKAAMFEIQVLQRLKKEDPARTFNCVVMREWFDHCNHVCMVFDVLDMSLFEFLKENHYRPFPMRQVRHFARQLVKAVAFLHTLKFIHTDLKPENILLIDSSYHSSSNAEGGGARTLLDTSICLIDFGSSVSASELHTNVVCTRHYRAPEIVLGLPWSYPCDMWSIGCVLMELFSGETLFQTHDNVEHLAMIERLVGGIPASMQIGHRETETLTHQYGNGARLPAVVPAGAAPRGEVLFGADGRVKYPDSKATAKSEKRVRGMRLLNEYFANPACPEEAMLRDLMQRLLVCEPEKRIGAFEALQHPFIKE